MQRITTFKVISFNKACLKGTSISRGIMLLGFISHILQFLIDRCCKYLKGPLRDSEIISLLSHPLK